MKNWRSAAGFDRSDQHSTCWGLRSNFDYFDDKNIMIAHLSVLTKVDDVFADLDPGTSFLRLNWKYDDDGLVMIMMI